MAEKVNSHDVEETDRISDLPDDVISNILSRLSTIEAMRTSALSRNWKNKWTYIYNVDINEGEFVRGRLDLNNTDVSNFQSFVDKVLGSLRCSSIRSFSLSISYSSPAYGSNCTYRWISKLVDLRVEKLSISCCDDGIPRVLPGILESCTSLTELNLTLAWTWRVRANCFPNLRRLYFGGENRSNIIMKNKQSPKTGRLLLSFPVLEDFNLGHNFKFSDVELVEIDAPELICFEVMMADFPSDYVMKIRAPKLEEFVTYEGPVYDFVLCMPSLLYVEFFENRERAASKVTTLLKGAPNLEYLRLFADSVTAHDLLSLNKLQELQLLVCVKELWKVLHAMPHLESLRVELAGDEDSNYLPEPFPTCLQLEYVSLTGFRGETLEFALVRFILENAKKLDEVIVYVDYIVDMKDFEIRMTSYLGPEHTSRITVLKCH